MTAHNQALGKLGERIAERWLRKHGYTILARRFKFGRRDIDLVAQRENSIAFVEVKARKGDAFGDPVEAVHHRKQRELSKSAQVWIERHGRDGEAYQFDVVGVLVADDSVKIKHVTNAFQAA